MVFIMKIVEDKSNNDICCPFCNKVVFSYDGDSEPQECPHTLLIATDEGVEFHNDKIDIDALENKAEEHSWDDVLSELDYQNAILIKSYESAPSSFGAYYLFQG